MTTPVLTVQSADAIAKAKDHANHAKLADAAQQFEAMMLAQMLKPLQFGATPAADQEEGGEGEGDTVRGMATEALAKAISQHGGMGIARSVLQQVMAEESARHEPVQRKQTGAKVQ